MRKYLILLIFFCATGISTVTAQSYPNKPVRLVVPFGAGGGTDIAGRLVAQAMTDAFAQSFVVDNRPGAGSAIGNDIVAKAPPDGYTLLLGNISLPFAVAFYKHLPYDTLRDFAPVTQVAVQPNILVVNPGLPGASFKEFVAHVRANPGKLTYGSAGNGSGTHLAFEMLRLNLGVDITHVPYKSTAQSLTDVIGNQVQMMLATFATALPHVKTGRLKALGVTTLKRSPAAPDVPALSEVGVPGYEYATWYGLLAPARTPRAVIDKLHRTAVSSMKSTDALQRLSAQGIESATSPSPAAFGDHIKSEVEKWVKVVRAAKIAAQ